MSAPDRWTPRRGRSSKVSHSELVREAEERRRHGSAQPQAPRQFDDDAAVQRLLGFPEEERARALRQRNPLRRARGLERALAISILASRGLRIRNLRQLHLNRNLRRAGKRMSFCSRRTRRRPMPSCASCGSRLERRSPAVLPPENIPDIRDLPVPAAGGRNPAGVQCPGDAPEARDASRPDRPDQWQHVGGEAVGLRNRDLAADRSRAPDRPRRWRSPRCAGRRAAGTRRRDGAPCHQQTAGEAVGRERERPAMLVDPEKGRALRTSRTSRCSAR